MIVTQAREPSFYRDLGVPDTVNGRFDVLVLHLWMVLRRFRTAGSGAILSQALFDRFCDDMDANLREMGVGDLAVPRKMRSFGEAFYGRSAACDLAFASGTEPLAQALCRNILDGQGMENARRLATYVERAVEGLANLDEATIFGAAWTFPWPVQTGLESDRQKRLE